jgi:fatty acid amide hydrolase
VERLLRLAAVPHGIRPMVAAAARLCGRGVEAAALGRTGPRDARGFAALLDAREALRARFAAATAGCDAIVCPVSALPALRHGSAARLVLAAAACLPANLLELAAGAVPVTRVRPEEDHCRRFALDPVLRAAAATDRGSVGLPVGVQVVGVPGAEEAVVLDVMAAIEAGA